MATTSEAAEHSDERGHDRHGKSPMVIVELDEPQSALAVRRLRKGKGRLFNHVGQIVKDLTEDGTIKADAQPIVIVVQEVEAPLPPWAPPWA
jgi:hypothetical protein